jgi:hypothetical protein
MHVEGVNNSRFELIERYFVHDGQDRAVSAVGVAIGQKYDNILTLVDVQSAPFSLAPRSTGLRSLHSDSQSQVRACRCARFGGFTPSISGSVQRSFRGMLDYTLLTGDRRPRDGNLRATDIVREESRGGKEGRGGFIWTDSLS